MRHHHTERIAPSRPLIGWLAVAAIALWTAAVPAIATPPAPVINSPANGSTLATCVVPVSGSAVADALVRVRRGDPPVTAAETAASASGSWSTTIGVLNGRNTITAVAYTEDRTDPSNPSTAVTFTVADTTAPTAAPTITAPTGTRTENDPKGFVPVAGTSDPMAIITITEKNLDANGQWDGTTNDVGNAEAGGSGTWVTQVRFAADGQHRIYATQADCAGNRGTAKSPDREFRVFSVQADSPVFTAPDPVTADSVIRAKGTATVGGQGKKGITVTISDVTVATSPLLIGEAATDDTGNWELTFGLANDEANLAHTLSASARYLDGPEAVDPTLKLLRVEDHKRPDPPTIDSPAPNAQLTNSIVPVSGTSEALARLTVSGGGIKAVDAVADKAGKWSAVILFPNGSQTISATAKDPAGNESDASTPVSYTINDTSAPDAPTILEPVALTTVTSSAVSIKGKSGENEIISVTKGDGKTLLATTSADKDGNFTLYVGLPNGAATILTTAADGAGNTSPATSTSFTVSDTTAPGKPEITRPVANAIVADNPVGIRGTAEPLSTITITERKGTANTVLKTGVTAQNGRWTVYVGPLVDDPHTIFATARDPAGNLGAASADRTFTLVTSLDPPRITEPPDPHSTSSVVSIAGKGTPGLTVKVYDNRPEDASGRTTTLLGQTQPISEDGSWSLKVGLSEGPHGVTATQSNGISDSQPSAPKSIAIADKDAPAIPDVKTVGENKVSKVDLDLPMGANNSRVEFTGRAEALATIRIWRSAANEATKALGTVVGDQRPDWKVLGTGVADQNGEWKATFTADVDTQFFLAKENKVSLTATDPAGLESLPQKVELLVSDSVAPARPTVATPTAGSGVAAGNVVFTGSAEPDSRVRISKSDGTILEDKIPVSSKGSWTKTISLDQGSYSIFAIAIDLTGNPSDRTALIQVTVTAVKPPVITKPANQDQANTSGVVAFGGTADPLVSIRLLDAGKDVAVTCPKADGSGAWNCSVKLDNGAHRITAVAIYPTGASSPPSQEKVVLVAKP